MKSARGRIERLESLDRQSPRSDIASVRREWALRLYPAGNPTAARISADPDKPENVLELAIDCVLADFRRHAMVNQVTAVRAAFARLKGLSRMPGGGICVRRLGKYVASLPTPDVDWQEPRLRVFPPAPELGPALLIRGKRHARNWSEAAWLAGVSGDGVYLAESAHEVKAFRVTAGKVRVRSFGGAWSTVGRAAQCEP